MIDSHDRMSHAEPYTLLGESPSSIEWEFLFPLAVSDEILIEDTSHAPDTMAAPVIVGFVTLVKVFHCVLGLLSAYSSNPFAPQTSQPHQDQFLSPASLLRTFNAVSSVLDDIPPELSIHQTQNPQQQSTTATHHFNIMKSNIHITKLYL